MCAGRQPKTATAPRMSSRAHALACVRSYSIRAGRDAKTELQFCVVVAAGAGCAFVRGCARPASNGLSRGLHGLSRGLHGRRAMCEFAMYVGCVSVCAGAVCMRLC